MNVAFFMSGILIEFQLDYNIMIIQAAYNFINSKFEVLRIINFFLMVV